MKLSNLSVYPRRKKKLEKLTEWIHYLTSLLRGQNMKLLEKTDSQEIQNSSCKMVMENQNENNIFR